jgi:hypothetical protein
MFRGEIEQAVMARVKEKVRELETSFVDQCEAIDEEAEAKKATLKTSLVDGFLNKIL